MLSFFNLFNIFDIIVIGDKMIIFLIIVVLLIICFFVIKKKIQSFLLKYFNTTDLNKLIEESEWEAQNTPKSVYGMESVYRDRILKDFPEVNLNEIKSMVEKSVLDTFQAIENGSIEDFNYNSMKAIAFVKSRIEDYKDKNVKFDQIHFHKTVLSRYENSNGIATMHFQTSLEYYLTIKNKRQKKVQDRYKVDFVYIIDSNQVSEKEKALGLNCPNCGAPITDIGVKTCKYCGSGALEIVKRVWTFNNIEGY